MEKHYRVLWRPMAQQDLFAIIQYIGEDSPATAKEFGEELKAKTQRLTAFPAMGKPGRIPGTRELVIHANYIIFYRVLTDADLVEILRLKHAKQQRPG